MMEGTTTSSSSRSSIPSQTSSSFPTGKIVPFPYENPYPQQVDFMEAILQALRPTTTTTTAEAEADRSGESSQSTSTTTTSNKMMTKTKKKKAKVLMLESPTGTGKSLSLACASVAWLRHMEQQDLGLSSSSSSSQEEEEEKEGHHNHNTTATATATTTNWWDDWKSPEEREEERLRESVRMTAIRSRTNLQRHLQQIASASTSSSSSSSNNNKNGGSGSSSIRRRGREHAIRLAISESTRQYQQQRDGTGKKRRATTADVGDGSGTQQQQDFCLEDYRSDSEEENRHLQHNHTNLKQQLQPPGSQRRRQQQHKSCLAATLLDGAALDGSSGACCSSTGGGKVDQTTTTTTTVGQTSVGSGVRKIVYAARTHSQLTQFVSELKRTTWGRNDNLRVVALASRKALCSNDDVRSRYKSEHALNEACLDMQKSKSGSGSSCPLKRQDAVATLALHTLAHPTDVEEASDLGKSCQACAYYASRVALPAAEVVVVPYSMLLSKSTRQSIGLSLQQSLVLVDEAHNVPEALRSMHSCRLTLPVVEASLDQLSRYLQKYLDRLAGRNLYYLGQLRKILLAFQRHLKKKKTKKKEKKLTGAPPGDNNNNKERTMVSADELLMECKLDNVNLFKLRRYLEHSRLSQKLLGFTNFATEQKINMKKQGLQESSDKPPPNNDVDPTASSTDGLSKHVSAMSIVETFLEKLTLSSKQGKFVTDYPPDNGNNDKSDSRSGSTCPPRERGGIGVQHPTLRYVLLKPAVYFENVLEEAHAVALVGGTLKPFVHVAAELLGDEEDNYHLIQQCARADEYMSKPENNNMVTTTSTIGGCHPPPRVSKTFNVPGLTAFTCDHVVPASNVLLQLASTGPTGRTLDFRHGSRFQNAVCDELGLTLLHVCRVVPNGVVVFLPSYSYEAYLTRRWRETGLWQDLSKTKKLYREPKSAQNIEASLQAFSRDASVNVSKNGDGACLFSVMGGKLSEGINFSGELARCVIVVGLPYPDITAPELREKMDSMDAASKSGHQASITGQAYYHNLCMRAVNQAVGRAIRSANDYAAILLADSRYRPEGRIWSGLPSWLRRGYDTDNSRHERCFEQRQQELNSFFDDKR